MQSQTRILDGEALLKKLNTAQREAARTVNGPLLVLAGAGTGKTRVITYRVAYLLSRGVSPANILAVTFTNKAAREMKERVEAIVGGRPEGLTLSTFHSLGMRILRADATPLGYRRDFSIHDTADQLSLLRTILRDIRGSGAAVDPKAILAAISRAKNRFLLPEDYAEEASDDWEHLAAVAYARYAEALKTMNAVDFDDLILLPVVLFGRVPEISEKYKRRFRFILVDEYQDTNGAQYRFLNGMVGPERNLCVVGDDDQSIYAFRGAEMDKILGFERDFPGAKVVKLEENYRSTAPILALANAVIASSPGRHEKQLRATLGGGEAVRCMSTADEAEEVDFVLNEIQGLLLHKVPANSVAILIRAANQARPFEEKLRLRRIPYVLVGGPSYFDRKEIRDTLAYWKVTANSKDDHSLLRILNVPRRGFGQTTIRKLDEFARTEGLSILLGLGRVAEGAGDFSPAIRVASGHVSALFTKARERLAGGRLTEMAKGLVEESSYLEAVTELYPDPLTRQTRWAAVEELLRSIEDWEKKNRGGDFSEFLSALTLDRDDSRSGDLEKRQGIRLMTLHSAKGLEFPHVFLVGLEDDLLPHKRAQAEGERAIEEERRLLYVGITRAQQTLTLTQARTRTQFGQTRERKPSRFLLEVADRQLFDSGNYNPHTEASESDVQGFLEMYRSIKGQRP